MFVVAVTIIKDTIIILNLFNSSLKLFLNCNGYCRFIIISIIENGIKIIVIIFTLLFYFIIILLLIFFFISQIVDLRICIVIRNEL